jgi:glycosyltransferase involved in cell wall biosynthesis
MRMKQRAETQPATVLYSESNVDGTVGGSHQCLLNLVENLDRSRYRPIVVFYEPHVLVDRFRSAAEVVVLDRDTPVRWGDGSNAVAAAPLVAARRAVNSLQLAQKVGANVAFLRKRGVSLVHLNNSIANHHEWMAAARLTGTPCVVHERGMPRYRMADRFWGREVKLIIPMSRAIADAMVGQGVSPANIRVMYDGVDPQRLRAARSPGEVRAEWNITPDQPVVGMVGNIREWKGQETVVRALSGVVRRFPSLVCLFVGSASQVDAPYMERLQSIVRANGLDANVRFTGYQRDVPSIVNAMLFTIHASIAPEPFGMVILEAMAQRKAVIASRAGGAVEMIVEGHTGFTVAPGDADQLTARMLDLLTDPARTAAMGEAAYDRALQHFSLERFVRDVQNVYDAILRSGKEWSPSTYAAVEDKPPR